MKVIQLEENQLAHLLSTAATLGAKAALTDAGLQKKEVTKAAAYRMYSRRSVDAWISNNKIKPVFRGSKTMLILTDLELLSKTNQVFKKHIMKVD